MGRVHHVSDHGPFTFLDASATCDAAGRKVTLTVVNRDRDRAHTATVDLGGATATEGLAVTEVNGPDVTATNSFERPRLVDARESRLERGGGQFDYEFPAHSLTVLRFAVTA
jgi:alpha-N-arabinofuranosidase